MTIEYFQVKSDQEYCPFRIVNESQSFILDPGLDREIYVYYTPDYQSNYDWAIVQIFLPNHVQEFELLGFISEENWLFVLENYAGDI